MRYPIAHSIQPHGNAWTTTNLGMMFQTRFSYTSNLEDIKSALTNLQRVVDLTPHDHVDLPARLNNLGNSFLSRFHRIGDLADLDNAIATHQRAIQLTSDGSPTLPALLFNLGKSFPISL